MRSPESESNPKVRRKPKPRRKPEPQPVPVPPPPGARKAVVQHEKWLDAYRLNPPPPPLVAPLLSYQGGKAKNGMTLAEMIESHRKERQTYIEPFVGGGNVICHIADHGERIGTDAHDLLINFFHAVQSGWRPSPAKPSDAMYQRYKKRWAKETDFSGLTLEKKAQIAWMGYGASYDGAWFAGRNPESGLKLFDRDSPHIMNAQFWQGLYDHHSHRRGCLIYCDPPYKGKKGFAAVRATAGEFVHDRFWDWCAMMVARNNVVLVSEETLPPRRYIAGKQGYMGGPHNNRQEYLIRVRAS